MFRCKMIITSLAGRSVRYFTKPQQHQLLQKCQQLWHPAATLKVHDVGARCLSSLPPPPPLPPTITTMFDDNRIPQIRMHPNGLGQRILPGGYVMDRKGKKQFLELALGYFWMIKDLKDTDNKPILSNETLIPEQEAEGFPRLYDLSNLLNEKLVLPDYLLQDKDNNHRSCSLVAIAFKQYGNRQAATWTEPFEKAMAHSGARVYSLIITEGRFMAPLLRPLVIRGTRQNTPLEKHDQTLLYFGNPDRFRDILRMHNTMAGYVFLLDGSGRVRFAGSGDASPEEVERVIAFANVLLKSSKKPSTSAKPHQAINRMGGRR